MLYRHGDNSVNEFVPIVIYFSVPVPIDQVLLGFVVYAERIRYPRPL